MHADSVHCPFLESICFTVDDCIIEIASYQMKTEQKADENEENNKCAFVAYWKYSVTS